MNHGYRVQASLEAKNDDLGVLRLVLRSSNGSTAYKEESAGNLEQSLSRISESIHQPLGGNFQLIPDFRVFVGNNLYLVKPMQRRFWLRSMALADADGVAMDLQDSVEMDKRRSQT